LSTVSRGDSFDLARRRCECRGGSDLPMGENRGTIRECLGLRDDVSSQGNLSVNEWEAHTAPLTVAAVARELGVAAATLRTWDRRYGLGPSEHEAGQHRRYTPQDVERLRLMRRLTLQGVAPADAARIATSSAPEGEASDDETATSAEDTAEILTDPLSLAAAAIDGEITRVQRVMRRAATDEGLLAAWEDTFLPARRLLTEEHPEVFHRPGADPLAVFDVALLLVVRAMGARTTSPAAPVLLWADKDRGIEAHVLGGALAAAGAATRLVIGGSGEPVRAALAAADLRVLGILGAPGDVAPVVTKASQRGDIEIFLIDPPDLDLWLPRVDRVRTLRAAVAEITASLQPEDA